MHAKTVWATHVRLSNRRTKALPKTNMTRSDAVVAEDAKQRIFFLHSVCCIAAIILCVACQTGRDPKQPRRPFWQTVFDFITVMFTCETAWLLNFFHCCAAGTMDRTSILPAAFASKAFTYSCLLVATTTVIYNVAVRLRRTPTTESCVWACIAACAYSAVARMARTCDNAVNVVDVVPSLTSAVYVVPTTDGLSHHEMGVQATA